MAFEIPLENSTPTTPNEERKLTIPSLKNKIQYVRNEAVKESPIELVDIFGPETDRLATIGTPRELPKRPRSS